MGKKKANVKNAGGDAYWLRLSEADGPGADSHWVSMLPVMLFGAFVILIVRAASYTRNMEQFYWTNSGNDLTDFFSYDKMICILLITAVALFILLYRFLTATMAIKKNWIYVPMGLYAVMVLLSYAVCDYKEFSLLGYNDRFEGTLVILAYLVMLFYIINTVNSEKNVKYVLRAVAASMTILCLLGFTQAADHDFFRTTFGKKLITPTSWWNDLDSLNFTFQNREIYQTVFNINYVSFYLALIVPIFALVMIYALNNVKSEKWMPVKAVLLVALVAALIFNLAGAKSMGGVIGLAAAFVAALVLFNKRLLKWWKAVLVLLVVAVAMFGVTNSYWLPEIQALFGRGAEPAVEESAGNEDPSGSAAAAAADTAGSVKCEIDYLTTDGYTVGASFNGNPMTITVVMDEANTAFQTLVLHDGDGNEMPAYELMLDDTTMYSVEDERYHDYMAFYLTQDEEDSLYLVLYTAGQEWPFFIRTDGVFYRNGFGKAVALEDVPAYVFEDNPRFGSGRGYIWSRTFGMLKSDVIIGDGADTYCIHYPQNDYVGKYQSGTYTDNIDIIVDKPHCMYLGMFQGTGGISMLCFLVMLGMYLAQALKVLRGNRYEAFLDYVAAGIFLGVIGFAVGGLFNDSTVSTMPIFYTMLGTGIAVNYLIADHGGKKEKKTSGGAAEAAAGGAE